MATSAIVLNGLLFTGIVRVPYAPRHEALLRAWRGAVDVELKEHRFGLTEETLVTLGDVRWPNGSLVNGQVYEITADYLDWIGVI